MKNILRVLVFSILITVIIYFLFSLFDKAFPEGADKNFTEKKENIEFGFNLDKYYVTKDTIKFGDSFGEILIKNKLTYPQIYRIVEKIKDSFDVRWLTVGKPYTILSSKDSLKVPKFFIYQPNLLNYVVIDFSDWDSISAVNKKKPFKIVKKSTSGIINSSLSETMDQNGLPWELINQLSDIYAWTIDFARIQNTIDLKTFPSVCCLSRDIGFKN